MMTGWCGTSTLPFPGLLGVRSRSAGRSLGDEAGAHGEGDGMSPVVCAESSEQSAGVGFHGVRGEEQVTTDFPVGLAPTHSLQDLQLTCSWWVGPCVGGGTHRKGTQFNT